MSDPDFSEEALEREFDAVMEKLDAAERAVRAASKVLGEACAAARAVIAKYAWLRGPMQ